LILNSAKGAGRVIGALFLIQVYIVMLRPVTALGFLATAAGSAFQVRLAVLLSLGLGALTQLALVFWLLTRRFEERPIPGGPA
jgi:hypothetical protein